MSPGDTEPGERDGTVSASKISKESSVCLFHNSACTKNSNRFAQNSVRTRQLRPELHESFMYLRHITKHARSTENIETLKRTQYIKYKYKNCSGNLGVGQ